MAFQSTPAALNVASNEVLLIVKFKISAMIWYVVKRLLKM